MGATPLALLALAGLVGGVLAQLVLLPALARTLPRRRTHDALADLEGGSASVAEAPVADDLLGGAAREPRAERDLPPWLRDLARGVALVLVLAAGVLLAPRAADLLGLPVGVLRGLGVLGGLALLIALLRADRLGDPDAQHDPVPVLRDGIAGGVLLVPLAAPLLAAAGDGVRLDDGAAIAAATALGLGVLVGMLLAHPAARRLRRPGRRTTAAALAAITLAAGVALAAPAYELPASAPPAPVADPDPPTDPPLDQDAPGQTYELLQDNGELTPFADRSNRRLSRCLPAAEPLARCGQAPPLEAAGPWFNLRGNPAPTWDSLRGRVVLIDFTSSACLTCREDRRHLAHWANDYAGAGLTVIAVHRPEYAVEADPAVPTDLVRRERIDYPLVSDPDGRLFDAFRNRYWPAKYLVDATGQVRAIRFGGGGYAVVERQIRTLLRQARPGVKLPPPVDLIDVAATITVGRTPVLRTRPGQSGYHGSPDYLSTDTTRYAVDISQPADTFSLGGFWKVERDGITADQDAALRLHFHANAVWQLLGGSGTVTVMRDDEPVRVIQISGAPRLHLISRRSQFQDAVITLQYSPGISSYGFAFE